MRSGIHKTFQFGEGAPTRSDGHQVSLKTLGAFAAVVIAVLALMNAYGSLSQAINDGDLKVRQTVTQTERVLREEIQTIREEIQGVRQEIRDVREEIQGVREEINANYRDLRDIIERSGDR